MLFVASTSSLACGPPMATDAASDPDAGVDAPAPNVRSFDAASSDVPVDSWSVRDASDDSGRDAWSGPCSLESGDASVDAGIDVADAGPRAWRSAGALSAPDGPAPRYLGWSAAMSGDGRRAILGAPFDDTVHGENAGTARVFVSGDGGWEEETVLLAPDGMANERLGYSVALSADGERAIVGSVPRDAAERGRGHVFVRSGSTWAREATLVGEDATSFFAGHAVAINADGCRAVIAAERAADGPSMVRVFARIGSTWIAEGSLVSTGVGDGFGSSIALDAAGDRAIVGVPGDDTSAGDDAGSARVFVRGPTGWMEEARLIPSGSQAAASFGRSVAMSGDGRWVVVGADLHDDGSLVDVGSVWAFRREDSGWIEDARLGHPEPDIDAYFGGSVSLDARGERALVGARFDDTTAGMHAGSARMFVRSSGTWYAEASLFDPAAMAFDAFGRSVALSADGERAVASAYYAEDTSGTAHVFQLSP